MDPSRVYSDLPEVVSPGDAGFQGEYRPPVPPKPGKVGIDGRQHEMVDEDIVRRLQQIFGQPTAAEQRRRHTYDINTTWFGVTKEQEQPYLHYSNRLVEILRESQMGAFTERFPQLVSFVGQTGAGKSTVIKMLIDRQQARTDSCNNMHAPVPGLVGDNIPTTGDVHLYEDPGTYHSQSPMLYADCEGMTGGENAPRGLACREKVDSAKKSGKLVKNVLRKKITWADDPKTQSREYAVTSLFPKILYTFSDVVVFVLREVRTFQTEVLTQLVDWAAMSIDKSLNQPTLPHVIIVANYTDASIDDQQWDPAVATKGLLDDYRHSVHQVPALKANLEKLASLGQDVKTTKELLEYYYSSVTVVRMPVKGRYMQMDDQVGKLYGTIIDRCRLSHLRRKKVRMLLNAEVLPQYVNAAYDHFSVSLDEPFDFIEEARRHTPLPRTFGGHILNLIVTMYNHAGQHRTRVRELFTNLSRPLASCIMLAANRENIQGSYAHLLRHTYHHSLEEALQLFCDQWLRCSYISREGFACQNARNSHQKGHQAISGRIMARGPYESDFVSEQFFPHWINEIDRHIRDLDDRLQQYDQEKNIIPRYLSPVMAKYYGSADSLSSASKIKSNLTCLCCVRRIPENILPCGHLLCKACVQAHALSLGQGLFHMNFCPLHRKETSWPKPAPIRFKPDEAGVRVMCLDGGGVRSIVEIVTLQAIERVLRHHIPVQNFFDLIVGSSTGGIIALGLGVKRWTITDCKDHFKSLCKQAFTPKLPKAFAAVTMRSQYKTKVLEKGLRSAFDQHSFLYGGSRPDHSTSIRVAVTSTLASENRPAVLSNYNTESEHESSPYKFVRPQESAREVKVWEAARATAAAPPYFKPFLQETTGTQYTDGAIHHSCPVQVADHERKLLWGEVSHWAPDILLSLGTGYSQPRTTYKSKRASAQESPGVKKPNGVIYPSQQWTPAGLSSLWRTINPLVDDQSITQNMWNSYVESATSPEQICKGSKDNRNIRINVRWSEKRPNFDDVEEMENIEQHAMNEISDSYEIKIVAHRLVASCFYFERTGTDSQNRETGLYKCSGNIICRFDEGSSDLKGLGCILRDHSSGSFAPFFILEEDYGTSVQRQHHVTIPAQTIYQMCYSGTFRLPTNLVVDGSQESSLTCLSLCLQPGGYSYSQISDPSQRSVNPSFSISGFPRELFAQDTPLSPRTNAADADEDESPCELPVSEDLPPTKEASKVPTMMGLFRNRSLHQSLSQMSFTTRPSSSEDKATESCESRDGSSIESARLFFGAKKRSSEGSGISSEAVDKEFESGHEASMKPFRGYY
ncbi:uncharacterized protein B0J16DRAFT_394837 [Fusarium flagelliforme]|uniref:uncharacterized protein n=1 Tax=Fusarium flagelliforme TaxID=2675880 RepID=UPI001E8E98E6|nr:uncharacterized protein B0J16DRAFT_394837 [Fusarium flagelliforme]KAH7192830.1 hypothetical protein B0J16DRAFT_394837 [Fusarium flagelliforme]